MAAQTGRRRKPRRGPRRRNRAEKVTERGRPIIATTTAPAPSDQTDVLVADDTGVFSTGPGPTPAYHYHLDQATNAHQVATEMQGETSEVSPV